MTGSSKVRAHRRIGSRVTNRVAVGVALAAAMAMFVVVGPPDTPTEAAPSSPVDESKVPHYFGPYPNWANSPLTQADATVTITGASVAEVTVGNPLSARAYATDTATTVFGVVQDPVSTLPAGVLTSFSTWNQPGSEGNVFHAYVLRPTGTADEYAIVFDSGPLTVPALVDTAGEISTYPVSPFDTQSGDLIGFYGQGIPVDINTGTDVIAYPGPTSAPVANDVATLGSGDFPIYPQTRTYSIAASVMPPAVGPGSGATAEATVGANGAVTGLTITNPGSGYTAASVAISGAGVGATATADVQTSGAVTSVSVDAGGGDYTAPSVAISGGGASTDALAHVTGGVDAVSVTIYGEGYKFPTVDFDMPDDPEGVQARGHAVCADPHPTCDLTDDADFLTVTGVEVDFAGSGYLTAPAVVVRDGTLFEPINHADAFTAAEATSTLSIQSVVVDSFGVGYTSAPDVTFSDTGAGGGAAATAATDSGAVIGLNLVTQGSGYVTPGGIKKFQDTLPGFGEDNANNLGQYIPVAVPDTTTFPGTDYYVIAVVQHREQMSSSLPASGTLLREYVQLETAANQDISKHVALQTSLLDGSTTPTLMPDGSQAIGLDNPHYMGPTIVAQKDRAVRIVFYNLLPTGADGDLFLPTDSSMMGSGMGPDSSMVGMEDLAAQQNDNGVVTDRTRNPECTESPKPDTCFKDNRALLHLHGGTTPWISDGTPHQWITPANQNTPWPEGVGVSEVPDMAPRTGVPDCTGDRDGCQTFYYTNQQSARLMFYHDHSWGITRLNVYAGEAAGYVITDETEQQLFGPSGTYADMGEGIPLIIQDRTFVPSAEQLAGQDPTWDSSRWGGMGNLWYHHVYMPAQNPGDPSGMSAYGRWMYGPWFWPPASPPHGPIANPYYNMDPATNFTTPLDVACDLDNPDTWQYQVTPFCEPPQIPGTPNISTGMEQFNDTPIVNGTAYPTTSLDPKAYRFRILNAANDRFWNLSWYVADDNGTPDDPSDDTEVALNEAEVAAAQTDINIVPTPDTTRSPAGPDWIQIANEGGFLPAPTVVPAQPTTWITDPTRFDVGNVDKHSMLLAPAERSDVIVDFSKYPGKTLILYNDAPAAFPARVANYDYYTGAPDTGAGAILPGYGPNTRTVMQVKIGTGTPAPAFSVTALKNLFKHHADGSGLFESSQHPIIVGQAPYNSAYGTNFANSGDCTDPAGTNKCDGYARINQQGRDLFRFDNLKGTKPQVKVELEPKAIHDEMNSASFDEFGRMTANMGLEAVPATPQNQYMLLYPYVAPPTEVIDGTNLPSTLDVQAISDGADGTQIWKITHNGVDTHPIHFHLYDVQVLNRVTWDNIIIPPDPNELGWKDTVRVSPLEDTIVALRPIIPTLPFEIPNSIRPIDPMMPLGANIGNADLIVDPDGNVSTIKNALMNYGWEYVYHCHILSHEEMDMMRPVSMALPPPAADGLVRTVVDGHNQIEWNDNSIAETSYILQSSTDGDDWVDVATSESPLADPNTKGVVRSLIDPVADPASALLYRVVARNTVGFGGAYPEVKADSLSPILVVNAPTPAAPTDLTAILQAGPKATLQWTDNADNEAGFVVERSTTGLPDSFVQVGTAPANAGTGVTTFDDTTIATGTAYWYRVAAFTQFGGATTLSAYSDNAVVLPRFEDSDAGLVFSSPGWWVSSSSQRSGGSSTTTVASGASLTVSFEGSVVRLLASTGPNRGIVSVKVDGVESLVDMYAPAYGYQQVVFEQSGLSAGSHSLLVTNTGTKNPSSFGTYLDVDAVEAVNVVAPVVPQRVEDSDAGLVFSSPGWWVSSSSQRSGGSSTTTVASGASLTVSFEGSVVRLLASTGPNRGIVSVKVDGVESLVDMYAPAYGYQQVVFEQSGLSAGSHSLLVTNTGTKNPSSFGTYLDVDAVEAVNVVAPVVPQRVEDSDAGLVFSSPGWWVSSSSQRSGGSSTTTVASGASLTVSFEGSVVRLLASTGPNRGIVSVKVDGVESLVDMYAPAYGYQQVVFEQSGLSAGSHSLLVTNTGTKNPSSFGTYLDVDAVEAVNVVAPVP